MLSLSTALIPRLTETLRMSRNLIVFNRFGFIPISSWFGDVGYFGVYTCFNYMTSILSDISIEMENVELFESNLGDHRLIQRSGKV